MPKRLIFDAFTLLICETNVANYALLRYKTLSLKIWLCKIFDKYHVCHFLDWFSISEWEFDFWRLDSLGNGQGPQNKSHFVKKEKKEEKNRKNVSVGLSILTQNVFRNWVKFATTTSGAIHIVCQYNGFLSSFLGQLIPSAAPKLIWQLFLLIKI